LYFPHFSKQKMDSVDDFLNSQAGNDALDGFNDFDADDAVNQALNVANMGGAYRGARGPIQKGTFQIREPGEVMARQSRPYKRVGVSNAAQPRAPVSTAVRSRRVGPRPPAKGWTKAQVIENLRRVQPEGNRASVAQSQRRRADLNAFYAAKDGVINYNRALAAANDRKQARAVLYQGAPLSDLALHQRPWVSQNSLKRIRIPSQVAVQLYGMEHGGIRNTAQCSAAVYTGNRASSTQYNQGIRDRRKDAKEGLSEYQARALLMGLSKRNNGKFNINRGSKLHVAIQKFPALAQYAQQM